MTGQLNTTVNGSSGTCVEAADWLMLYSSRADMAAEHCQKAINMAQSSWQGPASSAFQSSVRAPGWQCDDLSFTCQRYESALREFAAALDNVIERMLDARGKATGGGLEVEGPFILPPKPVGPGPSVPQGRFTVDQADVAYRMYRSDMLAHAANVTEYNRKARLFNECSTLVSEARAREDEAHAILQDVLATKHSGLDAWKVGHTTASKVVSAIGAAENAARGRLSWPNGSPRTRALTSRWRWAPSITSAPGTGCSSSRRWPRQEWARQTTGSAPPSSRATSSMCRRRSVRGSPRTPERRRSAWTR